MAYQSLWVIQCQILYIYACVCVCVCGINDKLGKFGGERYLFFTEHMRINFSFIYCGLFVFILVVFFFVSSHCVSARRRSEVKFGRNVVRRKKQKRPRWGLKVNKKTHHKSTEFMFFFFFIGGASGEMVIVAGIGHGDTSSNSGLIVFPIALIPLGKVWILLFSLQLWVK